MGLALILAGATGCGGEAEASAAQAAVCSAGRSFATDVGTGAYSWSASVASVERAAFDRGEDPVAVAGADFVAAHEAPGTWFEQFLRLAEECQNVGEPVHSDPRALLCDFQTERRNEYGAGYEVDYCS